MCNYVQSKCTKQRAPIVCGVPWIESKSEASFDSEVGVYNLIVSFSGIEHYGLGRYGDPIAKSADFKWVK